MITVWHENETLMALHTGLLRQKLATAVAAQHPLQNWVISCSITCRKPSNSVPPTHFRISGAGKDCWSTGVNNSKTVSPRNHSLPPPPPPVNEAPSRSQVDEPSTGLWLHSVAPQPLKPLTDRVHAFCSIASVCVLASFKMWLLLQ